MKMKKFTSGWNVIYCSQIAGNFLDILLVLVICIDRIDKWIDQPGLTVLEASFAVFSLQLQVGLVTCYPTLLGIFVMLALMVSME